MKRTTRNHPLTRWTAVCAALVSSGCAADQSLMQTGSGVVDGAITWERPEVGTIYVGGGMCTATLITPQVAVTAAHCVNFGTTSRPGAYGRFVVHAASDQEQQRFAIDLYRSFGRNDSMDVALVHLSVPVPESVARPAAITRRHPNGGEPVTLFGYGCTRRNTSIGSGQKRKFVFV
jgi:hypothetical protein